MQGIVEKSIQHFSRKTSREEATSENLGVDGSIILELILKKLSRRVCTGFFCLRTTSGELL
jgi:hypothetical protein